jgi:hypothetical protein
MVSDVAGDVRGATRKPELLRPLRKGSGTDVVLGGRTADVRSPRSLSGVDCLSGRDSRGRRPDGSPSPCLSRGAPETGVGRRKLCGRIGRPFGPIGHGGFCGCTRAAPRVPGRSGEPAVPVAPRPVVRWAVPRMSVLPLRGRVDSPPVGALLPTTLAPDPMPRRESGVGGLRTGSEAGRDHPSLDPPRRAGDEDGRRDGPVERALAPVSRSAIEMALQ